MVPVYSNLNVSHFQSHLSVILVPSPGPVQAQSEQAIDGNFFILTVGGYFGFGKIVPNPFLRENLKGMIKINLIVLFVIGHLRDDWSFQLLILIFKNLTSPTFLIDEGS